MSVPSKSWTLSACTIFASMLSVSTPALAVNVFVNDITGLGAKNFTDTSIWPNATVPTTADQAIIDKGDGINDYVYVDNGVVPLQIQRFNIGNQATGGLELRNGAYLFLSQGSNQVNVGPGQPGFAGVGYLRIKSGATLEQSGLMNVGLNPLGIGTITLEEGGTHIVGANMIVGSQGIGNYNMLGGSLSTGTYLMMGNTATGKGTFKQSGGTLELKRNSTNHGLYLGFTAGATGLYEISGGTLSVAATNPGVLNGANAAGGGGLGTFRVVGSAPIITIGTNYTQKADAKLDLVIGAGISPLNLGGNAVLDGILSASFTATPTVGQQFTIMNYGGTQSGTFGSFDNLVDSPMGPNSVQLSINYGTGSASSIVLTVDSLVTPHPGDFDGDGDVDAADYVIWRKTMPGNTAKYNEWRANFGYPPGSGSSLGGSGTVPEPGFLGLMFCVAVGAIGVCRRRRQVGVCVNGRWVLGDMGQCPRAPANLPDVVNRDMEGR